MTVANKFGDEGIVALAPALGKLVALTSLNLSGMWLDMRLVSGRGGLGRRGARVCVLP